MKKFLALVLALCMVFALAVVAYADDAASYKLGMGVSVSTDSTADSNAQVDATVAAVVVDAEGKIVACQLDCAQSKMDVSEGTADVEKEFLSKVELGYDYNMVKFSDATLEWFEQADGFEAYCVGKTADEIANMETVLNEEGHNVTTDETLFASCSISIDAFIDAVVKACNDEWAVEFEGSDFVLGVACNTTAEESTDPTEDEDGLCCMYTEFGAAVVDGDGVILACLNDAIQPKIAFDEDGMVGEATFKGTKRELGDGYNMVAFGAAIAEWDAQSAAFSEYCVGKTAAEILAFPTETNEEGHQVTTDEALLASCTMSIDGMGAVMAKAAENAA